MVFDPSRDIRGRITGRADSLRLPLRLTSNALWLTDYPAYDSTGPFFPLFYIETNG